MISATSNCCGADWIEIVWILLQLLGLLLILTFQLLITEIHEHVKLNCKCIYDEYTFQLVTIGRLVRRNKIDPQ